MMRVVGRAARRNRCMSQVLEPMIGIAIVWMLFHFMTSTNTIADENEAEMFGVGAKLRLGKRGGAQGDNANAGAQDTNPTETSRQLFCEKWSPQKPYILVGYDKTSPKGCTGPACFLNEGRRPVNIKLNPNHECVPVQKCVTVTIKTRHRYLNVMQFIRSIHGRYPGMKVVVLDEFNPDFNRSIPWDWKRQVMNYTQGLVTYAQVRPGVGYGRKLAVTLAETKYVMVTDDDYLFTNMSNIEKMVDMLESSDLSIVAGETDGFMYAGAMRVGPESPDSTDYHLALYPGIFYEQVPCFKDCYIADIVKTFFVARREAILMAGSWDSTRLFYEHEDFFISMRKARLKIAVCKDIMLNHEPKEQSLAAYRKKFHWTWHKHLIAKWQVGDLYICQKDTYFRLDATCEVRKHFS